MITKEDVIAVCNEYVDPEIGLDIWTLGLVYDITITKETVNILLTFTSPFCPYGPQMVEEITDLVKQKGAKEVHIEITFDPPWQPPDKLREMMGI